MHDYSKLSGKKRLRFRDWLIEKLDRGEIQGVEWIDRLRGLFKIPWVHGSRQNWCITDAEIFSQWAKYSGKYREGHDKPDPIKWKTNFRCTLNALPDFKEVRGQSCPRGPRGYKIYRMQNSGKAKKEQSTCEKEEKQTATFDHDLTDKEIVQMVDEMMAPVHIRPAVQKPLLVPRPNSAFPAFESLVVGKSSFPSFPFSCTPWVLAAWNAMAVDQYVEKTEEKSADDGDSASEGTDESSK